MAKPNLKFKMYTEDMDAEPVPFKVDFLADRARKDADDLARAKREGARAVEEYMREQQAI